MAKSLGITPYRRRSSIIIYALHGLRVNVDPLGYGWYSHPLPKSGKHHVVVGEFIYCGILVDGEMVISEKDFNAVTEGLELRLNIVQWPFLYFHPLCIPDLHKLHSHELFARCMGDNEAESDDDENYTFHLLRRPA